MTMTFQPHSQYVSGAGRVNARRTQRQLPHARQAQQPYCPRRDRDSHRPDRGSDRREHGLEANSGTHNRFKSIAFLVAVAIVLIAVIGFGSDAAATSVDTEPVDAIEVYIVQPGDTLWEIASEMAQPGEDVRQLVDELQVIAGGSQLDVGQRLVIDHKMLRQ